MAFAMIHLIVAREKNEKKNELLNDLRAHSPLFVGISLTEKKKSQLNFQVYRQALYGITTIIRISNEV